MVFVFAEQVERVGSVPSVVLCRWRNRAAQHAADDIHRPSSPTTAMFGCLLSWRLNPELPRQRSINTEISCLNDKTNITRIALTASDIK